MYDTTFDSNHMQFRRFPLLPWVTGCFVAGLLWGSLWHNISPLYFFLLTATGYCSAYFIRHNTTRVTLILISSFVCGIALMSNNTQSLHRQNAAFSPYISSHDDVTLEGRICGFPTVQQIINTRTNTTCWRIRCYCKARTIQPTISIPTKLLIDTIVHEKPDIPQLGDTIQISAQLSYPRAFRLNRWLTYRDYLLSRNVLFIAKNKSGCEIIKSSRLLSWLRKLRLACLNNLEAGIQQTAEAELIKAMILGVSPQIERYVLDRFAELGIIHIMVVSGLHVACLSFFLLTILQLCGLPRTTARIALLPILIIYLFLAGCKVSIVRAVVMIIFYFAADMFQRERNPFHACLVAGALQLFVLPRLIFDQGFHYSFLALFGLLAIYPVLQLQSKTMFTRKIAAYPLLTLSVWIPVAPLMTFRLGIFLPLGFLLSTILIFVVQIMIDIGILSVLLGFIWQDISILLNYSNFMIAKLVFIAVRVIYERFDIHFFIEPASIFWLVAYFCALAGSLIYIKNKRVKAAAILSIFCVIMLFAVLR